MNENSNAPSKNEIWATKGRKTVSESWLTVTLTTGYSFTLFWVFTNVASIYANVSEQKKAFT